MRTWDHDDMPSGRWSAEAIGRATLLDRERGAAIEQLRVVMRQVIDQLAELGSAALEADRAGLARGALELTDLIADPGLDLSALCERYAELRRIVVAASNRRPPAAVEVVLPRDDSARRLELGKWQQLPPPPRRHTIRRGEISAG